MALQLPVYDIEYEDAVAFFAFQLERDHTTSTFLGVGEYAGRLTTHIEDKEEEVVVMKDDTGTWLRICAPDEPKPTGSLAEPEPPVEPWWKDSLYRE